MVFYTFILLLLILVAFFLGQIAIQLIKSERKLLTTLEVLEEELADVFGTHGTAKPVAEKKPEQSGA